PWRPPWRLCWPPTLRIPAGPPRAPLVRRKAAIPRQSGADTLDERQPRTHMLRPDTLALTALLALLTAIGPTSVDMYLASLPEIGRALSGSPATVQLTLSVYLVGYTIGQIFYGPLSDRHGRRPVLLVALIVYCLASAACAAAPTIEMLLA